MKYLIMRDFMRQKQMFIIMPMLILLIALVNQGDPYALFAISTLSGFTFAWAGVSFEAESRSVLLWKSLPIPKWKLVAVKYLVILPYALYPASIYFLLNMVLGLFGFATPTFNLGVLCIIASFIFVMLISSLLFPFFFALSAKKKSYLPSVAFIGFLWLFSKASRFYKSEITDLMVDQLRLSFGHGLGTLFRFGLFVTIVAFISFAFSLFFYRQEE